MAFVGVLIAIGVVAYRKHKAKSDEVNAILMPLAMHSSVSEPEHQAFLLTRSSRRSIKSEHEMYADLPQSEQSF